MRISLEQIITTYRGHITGAFTWSKQTLTTGFLQPPDYSITLLSQKVYILTNYSEVQMSSTAASIYVTYNRRVFIYLIFSLLLKSSFTFSITRLAGLIIKDHS